MAKFDANVPIYIQIMNAIKQQIVSGTMRPGDKLLSVRDQAEALAVNPNTVQRAYQELEREGVSETRRGMGTFITEKDTLISGLRKEMAGSVLSAFVDGMRALGYPDDAILRELEHELGGKR